MTFVELLHEYPTRALIAWCWAWTMIAATGALVRASRWDDEDDAP